MSPSAADWRCRRDRIRSASHATGAMKIASRKAAMRAALVMLESFLHGARAMARVRTWQSEAAGPRMFTSLAGIALLRRLLSRQSRQ